MRGELINIFICVIHRVVKRNRDNFIVRCTAVNHRYNTDGVTSDKGLLIYLLRAKHQNVERVFILCIGSGYKAVVCRVVSRGIKYSVKHHKSRCFVKLIFVFAALCYLDNGIKILGSYFVCRNVMPNVHIFPPKSVFIRI